MSLSISSFAPNLFNSCPNAVFFAGVVFEEDKKEGIISTIVYGKINLMTIPTIILNLEKLIETMKKDYFDKNAKHQREYTGLE